MWRRNRRRSKRPTVPQAEAYWEEARQVRAALRAEQAAHQGESTETRRRLDAKVWRTVMDDHRVADSVTALRDARERNHFTERMRSLLHGGA